MRFNVITAVHQDGMCCHQFLAGNDQVGSADRKADVEAVFSDLRESQRHDVIDDCLPSCFIDDFLQRLNCRCVQRISYSVIQRHLAAVRTACVFHDDIGSLVHQRPVCDDMARCPSEVLKCQRIVQDRLDAGSRLLVLTGRMVQQHAAAASVVAAAAHCHDGTGMIVFRDHADFHQIIREPDIFVISGLDIIHDCLNVRIHVGVDLHCDRIRILSRDLLRFPDSCVDIGLICISARTA